MLALPMPRWRSSLSAAVSARHSLLPATGTSGLESWGERREGSNAAALRKSGQGDSDLDGRDYTFSQLVSIPARYRSCKQPLVPGEKGRDAGHDGTLPGVGP